MKLTFLAIICALFVNPCLAQDKKATSNNPTPADKKKVKINSKQSTVYITFERIGKRTPPGDDVSDKAVWLKLHNNIRFSIKFCAFSIVDEKGNSQTFEKASELGLNYEVELTNPSSFDGTESDIPIGNKSIGICHVYTLKSGNSIVFSVPAEHLEIGLSIKVPFNYEWENESDDNPKHFVYFNSLDILK